jgi:putative DNA primase/helicase
MSAAEIAAVLGDACREGVRWRCRCPLHGGLSLMLPDGDAGRLLVTCWGGCDRLDVLAEIRRRWLLDLIDYGRGGAQSTFDLKRGDEARRIARACETWHAALPALSSPIARYFASRGITLPPPPTLRWAPRSWHDAAKRELPAMLGLVEHAERGIVGIHRTYLQRDGSAKADIPRDWQKRALGPIGGWRRHSPRNATTGRMVRCRRGDRDRPLSDDRMCGFRVGGAVRRRPPRVNSAT